VSPQDQGGANFVQGQIPVARLPPCAKITAGILPVVLIPVMADVIHHHARFIGHPVVSQAACVERVYLAVERVTLAVCQKQELADQLFYPNVPEVVILAYKQQ
jgi:hypothetical protein